MQSTHIFFVKPQLPPQLQPLQSLALDLNWRRQTETAALFRYLDPQLWEEGGQNPLLMLSQVAEERLQAVAADSGYIAELERLWQQQQNYNSTSALPEQQEQPGNKRVIAYFSAEFGLAQSLPIYSGGLGILAGDHLKSASDLGLPLVGVGLLYRCGYFRQELDRQGWQQEIYPCYDFYRLPLELQRQADGSPLLVQLPYRERSLKAQIWQARVGRLKLYLLDTDFEENIEADRHITDRLYGGDIEKRIQQEILLGIGGICALESLGYEAQICHLNEGHSAFLALERIRQLQLKHGLSFEAAREQAASGNIFTTHTPVAAGIDLFPACLMDKYFTAYYQSMGLTRKEFLSLGRMDPNNSQEPFNMAVLALRLSARVNAVSRLHGQTARRMWPSLWPGLAEPEIPIIAITNGVHINSWVGSKMAALYDRYLGSGWRQDPCRVENWAAIGQVPGQELWQAHEEQRQELLTFARRRLVDRLQAQGATRAEIEAAARVLTPGALTIGFARRFATYKRATLLFRDPERLARLLGDPQRPLQIIYAGKAHPRDEEGKKLIRSIIAMASREEFRARLVFIPDYDINVARYLVQGVDVWLANPRRPLEASGTSGMKAVINGALHVSTLDGWWAEAWNPEAGWAIGRGEVYESSEYQDEIEAEILYNLLENEIIPLFYQREASGLPTGWLAMMKESIRTLAPVFNSQRMVSEYNQKLYLPAMKHYRQLQADNFRRARELAAWKNRVRVAWSSLKIERVEADREEYLTAGESLTVQALVYLGALQPDEVKVEIYHGKVDGEEKITDGDKTEMTVKQKLGEGRYLYSGKIIGRGSGRQGYTLRLRPRHQELAPNSLPELVLWG